MPRTNRAENILKRNLFFGPGCACLTASPVCLLLPVLPGCSGCRQETPAEKAAREKAEKERLEIERKKREEEKGVRRRRFRHAARQPAIEVRLL